MAFLLALPFLHACRGTHYGVDAVARIDHGVHVVAHIMACMPWRALWRACCGAHCGVHDVACTMMRPLSAFGEQFEGVWEAIHSEGELSLLSDSRALSP